MNNKFKGQPRPKDLSGLKRILKQIISTYKLHCFVVIVLIIASAVINAYGTLFLRTLIDDYITPLLSQEVPNYAPLFSALVKLACIYAIGLIASWGWSRIMIEVSLGTLRDTRDRLFAHMETLPIRYFDTHPHGDIMSVYTNDTDTLRQLVSQSLPQFISSACTIVSVLTSMLILSVPLTLVTLCFSASMIFISKKVTGVSGKYFIAQQKNLGKLNGYIEEMIEGSKVIKVFTHEEQTIKDFEKHNEELCEAVGKANTYANILMPILGNIGYLSYVVTAIAGAFIALNGNAAITIGTLISFLQLNRSFNGPIQQISQQLNSVVMAAAGAGRVFALLDEEPEDQHGIVTVVPCIEKNGVLVETNGHTGRWAWRHPRENGVQLVELKGDVRFDDVTFGYNEDKTVLHNISLFAKPGQKIAFVGATGAGKTTITNLINRFYDIQSGQITYDGIDIKLINKKDLRYSLGIVLQDVNLFTGTIMDNIRYGNLDATDDECIAAAKLANAHDFIKHLEHGYNTRIVAGQESLSQGQKQLISIARAAVADPPVLILDEATSSIDTRTERIVQDGMDKLMHGRTVFVIAHRLSTIQNSDAIMVLDQGRIIERGNHDELIEKKGAYYQLYTGNFAEND